MVYGLEITPGTLGEALFAVGVAGLVAAALATDDEAYGDAGEVYGVVLGGV